MSTAKPTIMDAPKVVQIAREHAILGYYPESLMKYKTALSLIQQRLSEIKDEFLREKWKMTEANVKSEIAQTIQIYEICKKMKNDFFDYDKKQIEENTSNKSNDNVIVIPFDKEKEKKQKKMPNVNHFGGKLPFKQVKENEDPFDDFKKLEINGIGKEVNEPIGVNIGNPNFNQNNNKNINQKEHNNLNNQKNNNKYQKEKENKSEHSILTSFCKDVKDDYNVNMYNLGANQVNHSNNMINVDKKFENIYNNDNNQNNGENFVVYKKPISSSSNNNVNINQEKKDPMVWDPPEDKNVYNKRNDNKIGRNQPVKKSGIGQVIQSKRANGNKANIAKMYEEVEKYKGNKKKYGNLLDKEGKENKDTPKSAFMAHHYPEGSGPDSELIEMLEREVIDTNPCVKFEDIAELDNAKNLIKEAALLPILMPNYFKGIRRPWRGVLLYGPPGTGKTMLAKALATQGKTTFFNVHSSTFASKWRGESEKLIRLLFEMARFYAPTTIFIDEVDSLGTKRGEMNECEASRRVKTELLVQMDGVSTSSGSTDENGEPEKPKIVMVLAATNRPWDLDEALRRRFEKRVYIPLPNEKGREELFKINLKNIKVDDNLDIDKLIAATSGYSGADVANVCREAALMPMRRKLLNNNQEKDILELIQNPDFRQEIDCPISQDDLIEAIKNIPKSVSEKDLVAYDKWTAEFKSQ